MNFVYQKTEEAKRVAKRVSTLVPKELMEKLEGVNVFLCGGVFTSLLREKKVRDLDFFFASEEDFKKAYNKVFGDALLKPERLEIDNAVNFSLGSMKIQFIKKMFLPTLSATLEVFDIRAVMCGMTLEDLKSPTLNGFMAEENSLFDIAKQMIVIMSSHRNPHNVCFRIAKYVKRGWNIKGQSFIRLILQQLIRGQNIKTLAEVRDEIMGVDTLILAQFFKTYDKFPPEQPIAQLELKEIMNDIDAYFQQWTEERDMSLEERTDKEKV